jgi:hypothetical protein
MLRSASLGFTLLLGFSAVAVAIPPEPSRDRRETQSKIDRKARGRDDAAARREDELAWFGGEPSVAYLDYRKSLAKRLLATRTPNPKEIPRPAVASPSSANTWQSLGPVRGASTYTPEGSEDVDSGRLVAILPHPLMPTTLYVASAGGGVWKCVDANPDAPTGAWTWTSVTDELPGNSGSGNPSPGALAFHPNEANTLYLGLGDPLSNAAAGRGFYISSNGGTSWEEGGSLGATTRVMKIVPLDDGQTILVGGNAGLWRSSDGGKTFAAVALGTSQGGNIWALEKLGGADLVLARNSSTEHGTIWTSADNGATWSMATFDSAFNPATMDRISLAGTAADPTRVWGIFQINGGRNMAKGLLKSSDKGKSWTFVPAPVAPDGLFQATGPAMEGDGGQGEYNQFLAVDPTDPNKVFVAANLALYRTMDGGSSWQSLTAWVKGNGRVYGASDFHTAAWSVTGPKTLYIGNDGGLFILREPDRAAVPSTPDLTFLDGRRGIGLSSHLVYHLASTSAETPADSKWRISTGMQDLGVRTRAGAGAALAASKVFDDTAQIGDGFGTAIHPKDGNQILASAYYCAFKKSTDGGRSWAPSSEGLVESGNSKDAPFHTRLAYGPGDPSGNTLYTFTNAKVYKSLDFGGNWAAMGMTGYDPTKQIRAVGAAASDPNVVAIVTLGNTGYLTSNGGESWTQFGAFPAGSPGFFSYVWFDRTNAQVIYVASVALSTDHNHLFRSADGGQTWTALDGSKETGNGFPWGIPVHVVQTDPSDRNILYAGTDFGVYRSADAGTSWSRYGLDLPLIAVRDLAIAEDGAWVRAGTYGRGVWELPAVEPFLLRVQPSSANLRQGYAMTFQATVRGIPDGSVTWSLPDGSDSGTLAVDGNQVKYTAPENRGTYTLVATANGDPSKSFSVKIHVR